MLQQREWNEYKCYLLILGIIALFGDICLSLNNADVAKGVCVVGCGKGGR